MSERVTTELPGTLWAEAFGGRWIPAWLLRGQRWVYCVCGPISPAVPLSLVCDGPGPRRRHRKVQRRLERMGYQVSLATEKPCRARTARPPAKRSRSG